MFSLIFFILFGAGFGITTAEGLRIRITNEEVTDVDPDTPGDQSGYKVTFVTEGEGEFGTSDLIVECVSYDEYTGFKKFEKVDDGDDNDQTNTYELTVGHLDSPQECTHPLPEPPEPPEPPPFPGDSPESDPDPQTQPKTPSDPDPQTPPDPNQNPPPQQSDPDPQTQPKTPSDPDPQTPPDPNQNPPPQPGTQSQPTQTTQPTQSEPESQTRQAGPEGSTSNTSPAPGGSTGNTQRTPPSGTTNTPARVTTEPVKPSDLVVSIPVISKTVLDSGESFTLSVSVENTGEGLSPETILRYYRGSYVGVSGTEVGKKTVSSIAAMGTSDVSISLTAPDAPGTYLYYACVSSVTGESNTDNNCTPNSVRAHGAGRATRYVRATRHVRPTYRYETETTICTC